MTPAETAELLAHAAAFDRRTIGRADIAAWQLALNDLPYNDARTAVAAHYATETRWIMPADIRHGIRRIRDARITAAHPLYDGNPDETPDQAIANRRQQLTAAGDGHLPPQPIRAALTGGPAPNVRAALTGVGVLPSDDVRAALRNAIPTYHGRPELTVVCPHCRAQPGNRCHTPSGRQLGESHPSRKDAYASGDSGPTSDRSNETAGAWPRAATACSPTAGSVRPAERLAGPACGID